MRRHRQTLEENDKCMRETQEYANTHLNEIMKIIQDLKTELNQMMEMLTRTQVKMKLELKDSVSQSENSGDISRVEWIKSKIGYPDLEIK